MNIYFYIEIIIFICFLFNFQSKRNRDKDLFYISALLFLFIYIFRSSVVGNDSPGYANFFNMHKNEGYGTVDKPDESMEIGIVYYGKILRFLFLNSNSYIPYFIFNTIFIFTPIIYLINKHSANKCLSLLWFMIILHSGLLVLYFTMLRQLVAMSLIMYGYIIFENRTRYWKILVPLLWIIAIPFHNTTIIFELILIGLYFLKGTKKIYYMSIIVVLFVRFFIQNYATALFDKFMLYINLFDSDSRILRYSESLGEINQSVFYLSLLSLSGIFFTFYSNRKETRSFYLKCYIFAVCIYILLDGTYMVNRLSSLFWVFGLIGAIPLAVKKNKYAFIIAIFFTIIFLIQAFIGYNHWPKTDSTLPYYFMWEK